MSRKVVQQTLPQTHVLQKGIAFLLFLLVIESVIWERIPGNTENGATWLLLMFIQICSSMLLASWCVFFLCSAHHLIACALRVRIKEPQIAKKVQ